jgi:hypothetical protein
MNIADTLLMDEQSGFRKGRSCSDNLTVIKQIIEKRREYNMETHIAFVDYEKAFDRVDRDQLWEIMEEKGYPLHLIRVLKNIYAKTEIIIDTGVGKAGPLRTNVGVRQGCSLSPTLFNIYIDEIVRRWKNEVFRGIRLSPSERYINTMLFADDQFIIQPTEDDLQRSIFKLQTICSEFNFKISTSKTKVMAFLGKEPLRTKIELNGKPIEQVSHFKYLGCDISYEHDRDIGEKIQKFQMICGTINRTLKNKARTDTQLKFYKTMAVPTVMFGSETWTDTKKGYSKVQAAEMKFLRRIKGVTRLDRLRNDDIRRELNIFSLNRKIGDNKRQWMDHIDRMPDESLVKQAVRYHPQGRRDRGRPIKRWRDP